MTDRLISCSSITVKLGVPECEPCFQTVDPCMPSYPDRHLSIMIDTEWICCSRERNWINIFMYFYVPWSIPHAATAQKKSELSHFAYIIELHRATSHITFHALTSFILLSFIFSFLVTFLIFFFRSIAPIYPGIWHTPADLQPPSQNIPHTCSITFSSPSPSLYPLAWGPSHAIESVLATSRTRNSRLSARQSCWPGENRDFNSWVHCNSIPSQAA